MAGGLVTAETSAPVAANGRIRDWARVTAPRDRSEWDFLCECGDPECTARVALTLALYDRARRARESVLARGHVRMRARAARQVSAETRAEAHAVRNQAHQQIRRTEHLLTRGAGPFIELICDECGYGVCVPNPPVACPMCRSTGWHTRKR